MSKVIIVESSAKIKTITRFLRGEYKIIASGGHIADLPKNTLGINVDDDFSFDVQADKNKLNRLNNQLEECEELYIATDPDREGEGIASDIFKLCHLQPDTKVYRIKFNAIVYHAVVEALEKRGEIDQNLVAARHARRALDRLIGFILSPITKFDPDGPKTPAVGRVIAPATALVVEREKEIDAFESETTWKIKALLEHNETEFEITIETTSPVHTFEEAKEIIDKINKKKEFIVSDVGVDIVKSVNPPPPFTTDALQYFADLKLGLSPQRTMKIAQALYQGIEIDGKPQALITYMRTDSPRMSPTALKLAKECIVNRKEFSDDLYSGRKWEVSSGSMQDAHEGIRPVAPENENLYPESLKGSLEEKYHKLFNVIYWRYLASQMKAAQFKEKEIRFQSDDLTGIAASQTIIYEGFLPAYRNIDPEYGPKEKELPGLEQGAEVKLVRAWPEMDESKPPFRYREGALVRALKERGIGRPSTYAASINKIKDYGYVEKAGASLKPTEKGKALCDFLKKHYSEVISYEYTANMEKALEEIETGNNDYKKYLKHEWETWLNEPYLKASENGWMNADRPSQRQIEYLIELGKICGKEIPDEVFASKEQVSQWIDQLKEQIDKDKLKVEITSIEPIDVKGVHCFKFKMYFSKKISLEIRDHLKKNKCRYQKEEDEKPHYHFQRQDKLVVEDKRKELVDFFRENSEKYDLTLIENITVP